MRHSLVTWLVAAIAVSCAGASERGSSPSGSGGEAGVSGLNEAGAAGACAPRSLSELCSKVVCPASPADVEHACGGGDPTRGSITTRYGSSCGGITIAIHRGVITTFWHYDAQYRLIGASVVNDSPTECDDERFGTYGQACELTSTGIDLCLVVDSCRARPLEETCSDRSPSACPTDPDALLAGGCRSWEIERCESSCGDLVLIENRGEEFATAWYFDSDDELIGVVRPEGLHRCDDGSDASAQSYGRVCEPQACDVVCSFEPDELPSGEGGAGGGSP